MKDDLVSYLITDPQYYGNEIASFEKNLKKALESNSVDMACFRDKESENFETLAHSFVRICKEFNINKILINGNIQLAKELEAHGVHLTSTQFDKIKEAKELDLYTVISCHTFKDIDMAQRFHCNAVTYSPIYDTPNKGEAKGISKLREAINIYEDIDIIALGGIINQSQVDEIVKTKAYGFASIRFFV